MPVGDVSRPASWVLRVTMVPLELYIINSGLATLLTVWDDSNFLLPTEGCPNELGGGICSELCVLNGPNDPSGGRGSVLSVLYRSFEAGGGLSSVLSVLYRPNDPSGVRGSVLSVIGFPTEVILCFRKIVSGVGDLV